VLEHLSAKDEVESLCVKWEAVEIRDDEFRRREQGACTPNPRARAVDSNDALRRDRHPVDE